MTDQLIPLGHPNRFGWLLQGLRAIVVHYTGNDREWATAKANRDYFAREWAGTKEKPFEKSGQAFAYGSAHIICDMNDVLRCIPETEVAWHCGENIWLPNNNGFDGRQRIAHYLLNDRPNNYTLGIEISNNDVIKNSDADWKGACDTAISYIREYVLTHGLKIDLDGSLAPQMFSRPLNPGEILLLRHYDVTGKNCPAPFVDSFSDWSDFVRKVVA